MHLAAYNGHQAVAQVLIVAGADVNQQDHDGRTPLHLAVLSDHQAVVQALIAAGANVNQQDNGWQYSIALGCL